MSEEHGEYELIARYTSEREVRGAIETLTGAGIGATSEAASEPDPTIGKITFSLLVVPGDGPRAREVLGLDPDPDADQTPGARRFPDWLYVLVIFLAAMIIVPLVAFYLSFKLSGG